MKKFGILVPVVTPCDSQGQVDTHGLISVCNEMTGLGCKGIFALGSTGRGPWFGREDRIKICRAAVSAKKEDTTIFAGVMASGLNDMLENAKAMADAGADIAVMTAPGYFDYSQEEIKNIFLRFIDQSPLPVLVYDIPDFTGVKLDEGLISDLVQHENVVGIKDSSGDRERFLSLLDHFKARDDLYVFQGKEVLLGESLLSGASGFVVSLIQIDPLPFVRLWEYAQAGNQKKVSEIQAYITRLQDCVTECMSRRPQTSTLFRLLGLALKSRGICENISMPHEGELPGWIEDYAKQCVEILRESHKIL